MGVSAGPELPDFDDPAVDPGVEEAQGRQWDDPGHEEDCPVEIVGHVVFVVPDQIRSLSVKIGEASLDGLGYGRPKYELSFRRS